jgi:uncharacterized membrane protein YvlD (DUF360 family)
MRILATSFINALAFGLLVLLLPGISITGWITAILAVGVVGYLNALVRPFLVYIKFSPTILTFGLTALLFNGLMVWLAGEFIPGITVTSFWAILLISLGMAFINVTCSDMLAIDDDDSFYQHIVSLIVKLFGEPEKSAIPGVLFLEIDGLSEPVLKRAIRNGHMPTLARWLDTGSHKLVSWECDLSSQTSASQAGILLGSNYDIPAFRWYEKDTGKQMVSNHPLDTIEIERRLSRGEGLLAVDGASRGNLFSGDAPQTMFTFSTLGNISKHRTQDFYPLFIGPYNTVRMVLLFLWDVFNELKEARFQRRHDVQPRIHRGGVYPIVRACTTILMRELCVYILIGDMHAGVPSVYTTFLGYDEVAHHSGVERPDAIEILHQLDEQIDRLENMAKLAPRPYHFVILSDHGQSQGATFKQRYGMTLEGLIRNLVAEEHTVEGVECENVGWNNLNVFLTDFLHDIIIPGENHIIARFLRNKIEPRKYLDQVVLGPYREYLERFSKSSDQEQEPAEVIVLASGNLGLIYFTDWEERISYEQINEAFPNLINGLTQHEGIGFVLLWSEERGAVVIGANGIHYLEEGLVEGKDPLAIFGPNAGAHLLRTCRFPHVADIMVNSFYDPKTEEVAAFEELVGSHGGLGGNQSLPFLLFPAQWEIEDDNIVGASDLHVQLKSWLNMYAAV